MARCVCSYHDAVTITPARAENHSALRHQGGAEGESIALQAGPNRLGPLHLAQLLVIEVVLLAVAVAAARGWVPAVLTGVLGALVVVVLLRRRGRRWSLEWRLLNWRLVRRGRSGPAGHPDPLVTVLRTLAPGLGVSSRQSADEIPVGIGGDRTGWFAALECAGTENQVSRSVPGPPLDRLAQVLQEADIPGVRLQVLTHTVPRTVRVETAAALGAADPGPVPAYSITWVVLRLDARALAEQAVSDQLSPPDVLITLVRRVEAVLRRSTQVPWRVLDGEGLVAALAGSCGVDASSEPAEEFGHWSSGRLRHVTFWVRSWPVSGTSRVLLDALSLVPGAFTSVSTVIEPAPGQARLRCLVRVAAVPADLATAVGTVQHVAARLEAGLERLDAQQGPAVYASAPTGGGI